jgi:hypothetical protein
MRPQAALETFFLAKRPVFVDVNTRETAQMPPEWGEKAVTILERYEAAAGNGPAAFVSGRLDFGVNRRAKLTPYRRPKLTPLWLAER